ncbi:MAG: beta-glucosidase, partial [Clostridiales bacterium]|nr:beta-glucosidase [Clostridiales bacterium]
VPLDGGGATPRTGRHEVPQGEAQLRKCCLTAEVPLEGKYPLRVDEVRAFVDALSQEQLILLATGDIEKGQGSNLGSSGISVPGSAAQTSSCAKEQGLADIVMADGPAGLRLLQNYQVKAGKILPAPFEQAFEGGYLNRTAAPQGDETYYQYCTAFPVGTALAQSWDRDLLAEVGQAVAEEMQRYLITSWLAPGMNIQRNPLCGRNFEYFSEDPLLAGTAAAAITSGVQSQRGCGATVKHFACNNQEDNRMGSDSILSERTLREIYLKGFEIAVRTSQPLFIMTSYNRINGVHAANSHDLCTFVARDEWGFRGAIMTDWGTTQVGPECTASGCMRAGNDVVMPGAPSDHENLRQELAEGTLSLEELKLAVCHLVDVIWRLNRQEAAE